MFNQTIVYCKQAYYLPQLVLVAYDNFGKGGKAYVLGGGDQAG